MGLNLVISFQTLDMLCLKLNNFACRNVVHFRVILNVF